jgi:hypothetical protein
MRKIVLILTLVATILAVSACTRISVDVITKLSVTNFTTSVFVVDDPIDLSEIEVAVTYTAEDGTEQKDVLGLNVLGLNEVNFYLRDPDNQLIDVERESDQAGYLEFTPHDPGTYTLYVCYGDVSVEVTFVVAPEGFAIDEDEHTVTLGSADAFAWFAETLNDDTENSTILREDGYEGYTVTLGVNIDLKGHVWTPIGTVVPFKGSFDGGGHTISNLLFSDERVDVSTLYTFTVSYEYKSIKSGLFHSLGYDGDPITVSDLTIKLFSTEDILNLSRSDHPPYGYNIGALSQIAINTTVDNVHVEGAEYTISLDQEQGWNMSGSKVKFGGIIGEVRDFWLDGSVVVNDSSVTGFDLTFTEANHYNAFTLSGVIGSTSLNSEGNLLTVTGTEVSNFHAAFDLDSSKDAHNQLPSDIAGLSVTTSYVSDSDNPNTLSNMSFTVTDLYDDLSITTNYGFEVKNTKGTFTFDEIGSSTVGQLYAYQKYPIE